MLSDAITIGTIFLTSVPDCCSNTMILLTLHPIISLNSNSEFILIWMCYIYDVPCEGQFCVFVFNP